MKTPSPLDFHNTRTGTLILALSIMITSSTWYLAKVSSERSYKERFRRYAENAAIEIQSSMYSYEQMLWSSVGLFNASQSVDREEWRKFVTTLQLTDNWPGIQAMGYSIPIKPDELAAHELTMRSSGSENYKVKPAGKRDMYSSIIMIEPFDWRNQRAFGYDMYSNKERRLAMQRARDSGEAVSSAIIELVQETQEDTQKGFLVYTPFYRDLLPSDGLEVRRQKFQGWVYAAFRVKDMMQGILANVDPHIVFRIYEVYRGEKTLMYDSKQPSRPEVVESTSELSMTKTLRIHGRDLEISYAPSKNFNENLSSLPNVIGIMGLLVDLLLFYVLYSLSKLDRKDDYIKKLEIQEKELKAGKAKLLAANSELDDFVNIASHDLKSPLRNISSLAELVEIDSEDTLSSESLSSLRMIRQRITRMYSLLDGLLHYSKAAHHELKATSVDLVKVASEIIEMNGASDRFKLKFSSENLTMSTFEEPLKTVLRNLLSNAIHHHDLEKGMIAIDLEEQNHFYLVSVTDDGPGIDPKMHDKIFSVFTTLKPRDEKEANGIGLSIVRKVIQSVDCKIEVLSPKGNRGTCFRFTWPKA